jgi:hypothetical protein
MRDDGGEKHSRHRFGAAERRFDVASRERLLAALDRLDPGLARVERELEALEAARLALLAGELCSGTSFDGHESAGFRDARIDAMDAFDHDAPPAHGPISSFPLIPDEIFEESLLASLTERAEDFITICRAAVDSGRSGGRGRA